MLETQILRTLTPYRELKTLEVGARNVCFNGLYVPSAPSPGMAPGWVLSVSVNESPCPSCVIPFGSLSQTLSSLVSVHQHRDNYEMKLQTDPNADNNLQRIPNLYICVVVKVHPDWAEPKHLGFWTHMQGITQWKNMGFKLIYWPSDPGQVP